MVWLEDPDHLDYVRQALDKVSTRRGKPRYDRDGRLVGYTNVAANAECDPDSGHFARRTFFLLPHDPTASRRATTRSVRQGRLSIPEPSSPEKQAQKPSAPKRGVPRR